MKKIPREHTMNYCGLEVKAPRTDLNRKVWVVFSDRENNSTFQNPGGKVKMKELEFLEPLVVIGEKGEFLKVVKYDSENIDDNLLTTKFKDRKKAKYYGWINRSNLLLTRQSVTDIVSGFKNKQMTIFSDTIPANDPDLFFTKDSIRLFKDVNLTVDNSKIPLYEIVYTLKNSPDNNKSLIARKSEISPDSAQHEVLGWIHTALIEDIGQRLHINPRSISSDHYLFRDKAKNDTISIPDYLYDESKKISQRHISLQYSPVDLWQKQDSLLKLKTYIPLPVLDQRDNYVFNVNGGKISYTKFKELEKELKNINLMFVFEGREQMLENYSALVNIVQNLQPIIEENQNEFNYNFGSVLAVRGKDGTSGPMIRRREFTPDYTEFTEYLVTEAENVDKFKPLTASQSWSGVRAAAEVVRKRKTDTNLMIIIGESGYSERVDTVLLNKIADANCRILGFQLHGKVNNESNNFVLQVENMINHYANKKLETKREMIVYADQVRKQNRYKESLRNTYKLDFPEKSMTQGWILFPEKDASMPLDLLTNSIDSMLTEIEWDNNNLINSLYKAFNTVGNHRYKQDSLFVEYFKPVNKLNRKLPTYFSENPVWYLPSSELTIPDSLASTVNYHLLLSQNELNDLSSFIDFLCANEVDYKYKGKKKKKKDICNCPDDDNIELENPKLNKQGEPEYLSTGRIRRKMQNLYLDELKECKVCKIKTKHLKKLTLAEAQRRIIGLPTYNPLLEKYTVNDIKKKKKVADKELDELITYIKEKKERLYKYIHNADKFDSNGQTYYWIDQNILP